uniref:Dolichyl-diphosphooligosaccharide--protein glycosyltransferase subunit DAD1 n=1 Tax=Callorhinchus milii TaxID=7868 RepID=A0A4W3H9A9_CALMI
MAGSVRAVLGRLWQEYAGGTALRLQLLDCYLLYMVLSGAELHLYCAIHTQFNLQYILSSVTACVTVCVILTAVCLRIQINSQNKGEFAGISPERAFADFLFASTILHLVVINFIG